MQGLLDKHTEHCSKHKAVNTILPKSGRNILKFKNIQNSVECPIKIYADFESFLKPTDEMRGKAKLYQRHVPSAFCFYVVSRVEGFSMDPIIYVGQNEDDQVDKVFVEKSEEVTKKIYETFKEPKPMIFDEAAKKLHESQNECYSCGETFNDKNADHRKVRDHCHYTGKYRGAFHSKCNLRLNRTRTIPVFFHNLTGYDCHLFVKRLADSQGNVDCIPRNEEKYITFSERVLVDTIVKMVKEKKKGKTESPEGSKYDEYDEGTAGPEDDEEWEEKGSKYIQQYKICRHDKFHANLVREIGRKHGKVRFQTHE